MAHLVEQMAYVGQTPWHGLGNKLSANQPLEVWQKQAGMDWDIKEAPVQFTDVVDDTQSRLITFPQSKVLYRSDPQAPLSVVSQRYQVVQPREILEFYRDLTEVSGFQLETAGVLKGGKKVWALDVQAVRPRFRRTMSPTPTCWWLRRVTAPWRPPLSSPPCELSATTRWL